MSDRSAVTRKTRKNADRKVAFEKGSGQKTSTKSARSDPEKPASGWTFLTNHAHVLTVLHNHPAKVLREVAVEVGITERAVQRIIQDLEEDGIIERQRVGRQNKYRIMLDQPLRHPIESHRLVGDLLKLTSSSI